LRSGGPLGQLCRRVSEDRVLRELFEKLCKGALRLAKLVTDFDAGLDPIRQLFNTFGRGKSLVAKDDGSVVVSVPNHTPNGLIHCTGRLLVVPV
jgi:hypothetical protein